MNCPKCGNKTKVVDSRTSDSQTNFGGQKRIHESVSWYTGDWVCRKRRCRTCNDFYLTVEVLLDDLEEGWSPKDHDS